MLFHSIGNATYKIGRAGYPQSTVSDLEPGRKVTDPDYVWQLNGDNRPLVKPCIGTVILRKGSAITDFISSATISVGFICSHQVQSIIRSLEFGDTSFYDLKVKHKETIYSNYSLMHCLNNYADQIDYRRSEFKKLRVENNQWVAEPIKLSSYEELKEKQMEFMHNKYGDWGRIEPSIIRMKENIELKHDIFTIWGVTFRVYVSERLRSMFDKAKITGVQYNFDSQPLEIV